MQKGGKTALFLLTALFATLAGVFLVVGGSATLQAAQLAVGGGVAHAFGGGRAGGGEAVSFGTNDLGHEKTPVNFRKPADYLSTWHGAKTRTPLAAGDRGGWLEKT
jgi:hypothetical protein